MKELSIEEKAKAYDEAIEKAKVYYHLGDDKHKMAIDAKAVMEYIFPALKESEDEMTRKYLISFVELNSGFNLPPEDAKKILAWLEKQGEQKHVVIIPKFRIGDEIKTSNEESLTITKIDEKGYWSEDLFICSFEDSAKWELVGKLVDKVEPKFNLYDWVVTDKGDTVQIGAINNGYYTLYNGMDFNMSYVDKCWRKWTIEDAKDGDVLVYEGEIFMIKSYVLWHKIVYHCCYDGKILHRYSIYDSWKREDFDKVHPATKEQRDTLMKAMADAGYTFDFEKKELKEIEQPVWSEEDETGLTNTIIMLKEGASLHFNKKDITKAVDWLKSLRPRSNQEVDEQIETIAMHLDNCGNTAMAEILRSCNLRPQKKWKPSDEQMNNILDVLSFDNCTQKRRELLESLYNELKKLKEE